MRLIAIDTALDACSVAVADGLGLTAVRSEAIGRGHAERLVGMIEETMAEAGFGFGELDRIAVTIGPGSFTGIRVGLATARGLALAAQKPIVGVLTLDAMVRSAPPTGRPVLVALDARRGETYARAYAADGGPYGDPQVLTLDEAAGFAADTGAVLFGSAARLIAAADLRYEQTIVGEPAYPDIAAVAALGSLLPIEAVPPKPVYLRAPDAKPQQAGVIPRAAPPALPAAEVAP